jgi:hypothetical protein
MRRGTRARAHLVAWRFAAFARELSGLGHCNSAGNDTFIIDGTRAWQKRPEYGVVFFLQSSKADCYKQIVNKI